MEKVEVTLDQIKEYLDANKEVDEVKNYISSISVDKPINIEAVKGYLEGTNEGKDLLQRYNDSFFSRAVVTHDEKNKAKNEALIAAKVNEKLMELNKEDTPEQKMLKEQAQRMKELEEKYENDKKLAAINKIAYEQGIDPNFVEGLNFDSPEHFGLYATKLKEYVKKSNEKVLNDYVAANAHKPSGKKEEEKVDLSNLSDEEILRMEASGELDNYLKGKRS